MLCVYWPCFAEMHVAVNFLTFFLIYLRKTPKMKTNEYMLFWDLPTSFDPLGSPTLKNWHPCTLFCDTEQDTLRGECQLPSSTYMTHYHWLIAKCYPVSPIIISHYMQYRLSFILQWNWNKIHRKIVTFFFFLFLSLVFQVASCLLWCLGLFL